MKSRPNDKDDNKNRKSIQILLQNQTECPICLQNYDLIKKNPMMICLNQHSSCNDCLGDVYPCKKCPICFQKLIARNSVKKNRLVCCLIEQMIKFGGETIIDCAKFKYRGGTKKGRPDGKGQQITKQGHYYKGQFKDGELVGDCDIVSNNGARFNGQAEKGTLIGTFITKFGSTIEGSFNQQTLQGTNCTKKYTNGDVFVGNVKDLKAQGFGKLIFNSGNSFEGSFHKDYIDRNCQGTICGTFPIQIVNQNIRILQIEEQVMDSMGESQANRSEDRIKNERQMRNAGDSSSSESSDSQ